MTPRSAWRGLPRAVRLTAAVLACLSLAGAGLWLARGPIAEWAIERTIDDFGLGPSEVVVERLGWSRAEARLVRSAAGTVEGIEARYSLGGLLRGALDSVRIEDARLHFGWRDGKLIPEIRSSGGPIALPVKRLEISRSSLTLDLDAGPITLAVAGTVTGGDAIVADLALTAEATAGAGHGRLSGRLAPDGAFDGSLVVGDGWLRVGAVEAEGLRGRVRTQGGADGLALLDAALGFERIASSGAPLGAGRLTGTLRQPGNRLDVALESRPVTLALRADGAEPGAGVPFGLSAAADAGFLSSLAGASRPATGEVSVAASGTTPPAASLQGAAALGLGDWLRDGRAEASLNADVTGFAVDGGPALARGKAGLSLRLAGGALALAAPGGLALEGLRPDGSVSAPFDGPVDLRIEPRGEAPLLAVVPAEGDDTLALAGRLMLRTPTLSVRAGGTLSATLDPAQWLAAARTTTAAGRVAIDADLSLRQAEGLTLPSATLRLSGDYAVEPLSAGLTVAEGALAARDAGWGAALSLPGTARARIEPGSRIERHRETGQVTAAAALRPSASTAALARDGDAPVRASFGARRIALALDADGVRAALEGGATELAEIGIAARGVAATMNLRDAATALKATVAELVSLRQPALFAPLRVGLDAHLADSTARFTATVTGADGRIEATATGRHDLKSGNGTARIALEPLDLSGDGAIAALAPALADSIRSATGTIAAAGDVAWGEGAAPGALTITLDDVGLAGEAVTASSFDGVVTLDGLAPLSTPAGQRLSGTLQLPRVALVPVDVVFRLDPGELVLERASARIFGGTFSTANAVLRSATGEGRLDLRVSDVNLETAFAVLDLEQLDGTGRLGGTLPLRIRDGRVAIDDGHLESSTPGTVQVGVEALADQLKEYGENVDMAFRALTDFHYDRMAIDATKPFAGAGKAVFRLEGHNPKVMDGQPFVFNITLETDFDYLAGLLLELSGAANTALGWGARELGGK